ncbi:MAG: indolepyruvate ferredoxin oxidoreductase subunit alpha, partial [Clostridia bacterium]
MSTEFLMGNQAIAMAAIHSGVNYVSGYPGTPSTEILETVAKNKNESTYVEWSVNEKAALEVAAGAAYSGAYTMVTMKQVGLNVASDPLMSLAYIGIKGAMVIVVADDPGPISSQTEQDTRQFASFCKLPVFDPSSPEEAYSMVFDAFDYSNKYQTPVILRPTTRVCHGYAMIDYIEEPKTNEYEGFIKDPKWTIFPRLSYQNHIKLDDIRKTLGNEFSDYKFNFIEKGEKKAIATASVNYQYTKEALSSLNLEPSILKISTPYPFPEKLAVEFLSSVDTVLCIEELEPVVEKELIYICGKYNLPTKIYGKLSGDMPVAGENTTDSVKISIAKYYDIKLLEEEIIQTPELPIRPPVLCAGCPHRASFYAVKKAMKGQKAVFSGDIGCYTLGNAKPLDMVDTCLCMGAGITIAQGLNRIEPDAKNFAFVGDSTFFASGITGVVNAIYNQSNIVLIVLDNSTTAMTGHQPHPGTALTMMGEISQKISIEKTLKALGVEFVETVDPLDLEKAISTVKRATETSTISAVIFKSPCIALFKNT